MKRICAQIQLYDKGTRNRASNNIVSRLVISYQVGTGKRHRSNGEREQHDNSRF